MSPSINIPPPQLPAKPTGPPIYGASSASAMQGKKKAGMEAGAFGSFLGSAAQAPASTGSKTLLGQ